MKIQKVVDGWIHIFATPNGDKNKVATCVETDKVILLKNPKEINMGGRSASLVLHMKTGEIGWVENSLMEEAL